MKKWLAKICAAALAVVACFTCFAGCNKDDKNVKVMKDILLTEEDYAFAIAKENTELLTAVNACLAEWKEDGSLDALINSYFDGAATFSEMYAMDFATDSILMCHAGEGNWRIARKDRKPRLIDKIFN